jgi:hypothetical protein
MFSFDTLKDSIEFLAKQQAEINDRLTTLENKPTEYVPITVVEKEAPPAPPPRAKTPPKAEPEEPGVPLALFL